MNTIHPTAIIDPTAKLGTNNYVGPFCIIGPNVVIGNNNRFESSCSIGSPPEHKSFWNGEFKSVEIGNDCVFREFITVNSGTLDNTRVHDHVVMLRGSHAGHDVQIQQGVTVSCQASIGGESVIWQGANLGMGVMIHQRSQIAPYSMLGMGCIVTKSSEILPFEVYIGNPARHLRRNQVGLERCGLNKKQIEELEAQFLSTIDKVKRFSKRA
jgi:UDP-N-acetylglucosamine acyltransferase